MRKNVYRKYQWREDYALWYLIPADEAQYFDKLVADINASEEDAYDLETELLGAYDKYRIEGSPSLSCWTRLRIWWMERRAVCLRDGLWFTAARFGPRCGKWKRAHAKLMALKQKIADLGGTSNA